MADAAKPGDDIDALMAQLKGGTPAAATPPAAGTPSPTAEAGDPEDAEVDALLAKLGGTPAKKPAAAPAKKDAVADALLAQLSQSAAASNVSAATATFAPPKAPADPPPAPGSTTADAEVDAILAQLANRAPTTSVSAPAHTASEVTGALTARGDAAPAQPGTGSGSATRAGRDESDAHALLPSDASNAASADSLDAVLQALPPSRVHTGRQVKKPGPKLGLSQEDIDGLIAKHGEAPAEAPAETMISQDDIDALVKQLSAATSKLAATAAIRAGTRSVPAPAGDASRNRAALAATLIAPQAATGTTSLTDVRRAVVEALPPVMARSELRSTRWLLAAAVVLLATCAATMAVMAGSVHRLGAELAKDRERAETAAHGADAAVEMKAALALLGSTDETDAERGVVALDRLKTAYPAREDDIDLALARHFRAHGRDRLAAERYGALFDRAAHPLSDPGVHLEYAECLADLGDVDAALRRCYALLADERGFRAERDADGRRRGEAELKRVDEAMARAELLRGRLLADLAVSAAHAEPAAAALGRADHPVAQRRDAHPEHAP